MKIYALLLSVLITINSIIPYAMLSNSYYIDRYGWAQDLADGLQQFIYDGAGAIRGLIETADSNPWLDGNNSLTRSGSPAQSPSVAYYDESVNTTSTDMRTYTYNHYTTNSHYETYQMAYNDNRNYTYTYNPVYNDYRTYDYRTYNNYTFYDDDYYYYITVNNITNQEFYIINKVDVNDNRYYQYYFEYNSVPSWNLTIDDVLGIYFNHDNYLYTQASDDDRLLALFHLDGSYDNVIDSDVVLHYNSNSFVNGRFDGGIKTDYKPSVPTETTVMYIDGINESSYTCEFWFYNMIENGSYDKLGSPYAWHHLAYVYDEGVLDSLSRIPSDMYPLYKDAILNAYGVRVYVDGVEVPRAEAMIVSPVFYADGRQNTNTISRTELRYDGSYTLNNPLMPITSSPSYLPWYGYTGSIVYSINSPAVYRLKTWLNLWGSSALNNVVHSNEHYEPEFYSDKVWFGFSDNYDSCHVFPVGNSNQLYYHKIFGDSFDYVQVSDTVSQDSNYGLPNLSTWQYVSDLRGSFNSKNQQVDYSDTIKTDMSECIMDEIRITKGVLYDGNFTPPLDKFSDSFVWVAPSGNNYNYGDIAYQTNITINNVRVGGSMYSYPSYGDVYIDINGVGVGSPCYIYNGQSWSPINYSVWNGSTWQDGNTFNFRNLTFYDVAVSSNEFDYDYLRQINDKLGLVDEKLGTGNDLLRSIISLITTGGTIEGVEYSQSDLADMSNSSVDAYNPLNENNSQVEGSFTSTLLGWKDVLLPFVIALILLAIVLIVFRIVIDLGVWVATLFSVSALPTPSYDFNKGLQWFQGIPYEENGNIVEPFYVFTFGNVHFTLYDFCVIVFNVVFIGAMIKLGKRLIGNIKMKGE